jgi:hypothetical protein
MRHVFSLHIVHKDGIKRVLLTESAGGSTKRYFDQAELKDLFKLAPADAPCSMLEKFGQSAMGSSGKISFLNKDPNVVGVASHDRLYSNATGEGNTDSSAVDLTSSSKTPFSREPFKNTVQSTPPIANDVEVIDINEPKTLKPLGSGLNRTRENRENAKARRQDNEQRDATKSAVADKSSSAIDNALSKAHCYMANDKHADAMDVLLGLLENENNAIQGESKLKVHESISFVASKLGWL